MAATLITPPPVQEVAETEDALEAHVQRILRSPHFARAETQRRLLEYLWQHRHENLSEYALATEALGRSRSFDSTVDASVRVHISRLRRKLKDYYIQESADPEMLVIPTGTHQLLVVDQTNNRVEAVEIPALPEAPVVDYRRRMWIMAAVAMVFAVATVVLGLVHFAPWQKKSEGPKVTAFWSTFLQGTGPIKLFCLRRHSFSFPMTRTCGCVPRT